MPKKKLPDLLQPVNSHTWRPKVRRGHAEGNCPGCAVEDLIEEAEHVLPVFEKIFEYIKNHTPCNTDKHKLWGKLKNKDASQGKYVTTRTGRTIMGIGKHKVTQSAGLKGAPRIEQKCYTKYYSRSREDKILAVRYINDVVRGTLTFTSCADMITALDFIIDNADTHLPDVGGTYKIARAKQIYEPKGALLYGDIKLNLEVTTPAGIRHNCELQINHLEMIRAKGTSAGHGAYESWRDMDDEHWLKEKEGLPLKLGQMSSAYLARAQRIVHSSHSAYYRAATALQNDRDYEEMIAKVDAL